MGIDFWNSCLDICFLNFWLINTGLDFKPMEENMLTIVLCHRSETSPMWKLSLLLLGTLCMYVIHWPWAVPSVNKSYISSLPKNNSYLLLKWYYDFCFYKVVLWFLFLFFYFVFIFIFSFVIGTEKPLWGSGQ